MIRLTLGLDRTWRVLGERTALRVGLVNDGAAPVETPAVAGNGARQPRLRLTGPSWPEGLSCTPALAGPRRATPGPARLAPGEEHVAFVSLTPWLAGAAPGAYTLEAEVEGAWGRATARLELTLAPQRLQGLDVDLDTSAHAPALRARAVHAAPGASGALRVVVELAPSPHGGLEARRPAAEDAPLAGLEEALGCVRARDEAERAVHWRLWRRGAALLATPLSGLDLTHQPVDGPWAPARPAWIDASGCLHLAVVAGAAGGQEVVRLRWAPPDAARAPGALEVVDRAPTPGAMDGAATALVAEGLAVVVALAGPDGVRAAVLPPAGGGRVAVAASAPVIAPGPGAPATPIPGALAVEAGPDALEVALLTWSPLAAPPAEAPLAGRLALARAAWRAGAGWTPWEVGAPVALDAPPAGGLVAFEAAPGGAGRAPRWAAALGPRRLATDAGERALPSAPAWPLRGLRWRGRLLVALAGERDGPSLHDCG